ncbi:hypothetical protein [Pseudomonas triticicola]|uniref:hypothetical protein n=1 Tax=Pseudomonas triticicola TaxID=2842345 RepID=UPI003EB75ED6
MSPESPLRIYSRSRSDEVLTKLKKAMEAIEKDIQDNDGLYPFNKGKLSLAEVCRRASIHKITLQGEKHNTTTKVVVKEWLQNLNRSVVIGVKTVRKRVTASADEWRDRYFEIARKYNEMYAINIVSMQSELDKARSRIADLESENIALRVKLSVRGVSLIAGGESKKDIS